jgi:hypothetical protein
MCHEVVDDTMLVIQGPSAPSGEEWTAHCRGHATLTYHGVLVVADQSCPGPTSRQRAELADAFKARARVPDVAVVTASSAHRGIVTVMNWLQKGSLKAYPPTRLGEALKYAGVAPSAYGRIVRRIHELALSVNAPWIVQAVTLPSVHEASP